MGRLKLGIALPLSERTIRATEAARAVEERGFESMWAGEHSHLPVDSVHSYTKGRYAGSTSRGGRVPEMYQRFLDPFVVLASAAAVTNTIRVGTAACIASERSVLHLAKEVATLDLQSGGRLELGMGFGWNDLEALNHGIDPLKRREILDEKVEALKALWMDDTTAFSGEFVNFAESWAWPKPVQTPHPPIHLAAGPSPATFRRVVEWADGWMPVKAMAHGDMVGWVTRLRQTAEHQGRDPRSIGVTVIDPEASFRGKRDLATFEASLPSASETSSWAEVDIDRVVIRCPADDRDLLYQTLDAVSDWSLRAPGFR
jgi:probable F420-dependent oxidoreductase